MRYYTRIRTTEIEKQQKNGDNTKYWQGCKPAGSLNIAAENAKWYSQSGKQNLNHIPNCPIPRFLPREMKAYVHTKTDT